MTAAFDWSPGGCCCILTGPWDFYYDAHDAAAGPGEGYLAPETPLTPYIPRAAAIYLSDPPEGGPADWDSYSDWFVTIDNSGTGVDFQSKTMLSSICPLGIIDAETVYVYMEDIAEGDSQHTGMAQVDAENLAVDWIVTDKMWEDDSEPIMGSITIAFAGILLASSEAIAPPAFDFTGACAHSDGLVKWQIDNGVSQYALWTIDAAGAKSYSLTEFVLNWTTANPGYDDWDIPLYPYKQSTSDPYNQLGSYGPLQAFVPYHLPIGMASQANVAFGINHTQMASLPVYDAGAGGFWIESLTFDAEVTVAIGPISQEVTYGYPLISGSIIWSKAIVDYHADSTYGFIIPTNVDAFDASPSHSVAVITYSYASAWSNDTVTNAPYDLWTATELTGKTTLVVDGTELSLQVNWISAGGYTTDNREFWPRWIAPRMLQHSEAAQGDAQRAIVFQRSPFDDSEAVSTYDSETALHQWNLRCYNLADGWEYSFLSHWGRAGRATGEITFDTTNSATFTLLALEGGNADGALGNALASIVIEQTDPDEAEEATFSGTVLTVKIDIAGGHDTIDDLADIIHHGGDWVVTAGLNGTDTITTAKTGEPTSPPFTGGDSSAGTVTDPYVHTSSDRYFYLSNFPLLKYETVDNGIGGTVVRAILRDGDPTHGLVRDWMIAHDNSHANPCGNGVQQWDRAPNSTDQAVGNTNWDSIKNSDLLPLSPELKRI